MIIDVDTLSDDTARRIEIQALRDASGFISSDPTGGIDVPEAARRQIIAEWGSGHPTEEQIELVYIDTLSDLSQPAPPGSR